MYKKYIPSFLSINEMVFIVETLKAKLDKTKLWTQVMSLVKSSKHINSIQSLIENKKKRIPLNPFYEVHITLQTHC